MLEFGIGSQAETNLLAGVDSQDLSTTSARESALVAPGVGPIDSRTITEIRGRVGRELDRVVLGLPGGLADVLVRGLGGAVDDVGVKPVVCRNTLGGDGADSKSGELHSEKRRWGPGSCFVESWNSEVETKNC